MWIWPFTSSHSHRLNLNHCSKFTSCSLSNYLTFWCLFRLPWQHVTGIEYVTVACVCLFCCAVSVLTIIIIFKSVCLQIDTGNICVQLFVCHKSIFFSNDWRCTVHCDHLRCLHNTVVSADTKWGHVFEGGCIDKYGFQFTSRENYISMYVHVSWP